MTDSILIGRLLRTSKVVQTFTVTSGMLPQGTKLLVDWESRDIEVVYPRDAPTVVEEAPHIGEVDDRLEMIHPPQEPATAIGEAILDAAKDRTNEEIDAKINGMIETKDKLDAETAAFDYKEIVTNNDGWQNMPYGRGLSTGAKGRNSYQAQAFKALKQHEAKSNQPACCYSLEVPGMNTNRISETLSRLFRTGVVARKKYHCGCAGTENVNTPLMHYSIKKVDVPL
jgi:hypothetical protein